MERESRRTPMNHREDGSAAFLGMEGAEAMSRSKTL